MEKLRSQLGINILYVARRTKLSLSCLARVSGIPKSTLQNWTQINGKIELRIEILKLIQFLTSYCETKKIKIKGLDLENFCFEDLESLNDPSFEKSKSEKIKSLFKKISEQQELFGDAV